MVVKVLAIERLRKDYRQREVAPKVDAYFAWVKETIMKVTTGAIPTRHSRIV